MPLHKEQGNEHFREALARVIAETVEFPPGVFITVLDAKVSPSQHDAVVTLTVFPKDRQKDVLNCLETFKRSMKDELARSIKLRHIPKFNWKFDDAGAYVEDIDTVIAELRKKGDL